MSEDHNQVKEDLLGCWGSIKEVLGIVAGVFGCGLLYLLLYAVLGPRGMVFLGRFLLWAALVTLMVKGAVYVTNAYRRGRW